MTTSPSFTAISATLPAAGEGTSKAALSVSSSTMACSFSMVSPSDTSSEITSPESTFSEISGSFTS